MTGGSARELDKAFAAGNYHRVAASGRADRWQTFAALGLCGNTAPALEGLRRFDVPEARFYEAAVHWIDGDEDAAARLLETCEGEHPARLLTLIRKRRIEILAQLPWSQFGEGPHTVLEAARSSAKFSVRNIGFSLGDLQNSANANIHAYYDRNNPPDFYLAQMIEWQLIPPNLQELPCPIIGQTADFDLHIHVVRPWLQMFDQILVSDMTEFDDAARLVDCPVSTFPKICCHPRSLPPAPQPGGRDIDLLLTGTTFHAYHREKAEILHQILRVQNIEPFIMNGYLDWWQYHAMLARTKLSVAQIRHPGAAPSRGVETLAMGTVLLAQPETTIRLWVGEEEGLLTYELEDGGLGRCIERVLAEFPKHEAAARRGMAIIRDEFEPDRLGAQYLRFATFRAARPQGTRNVVAPPAQKRLVAWQGWLPKVGNVHSHLHDAALKRLNETPPDQQTVETLSGPTRETMLDFVQHSLDAPSERHQQLFTASLEIFRIAVQVRPQSLALRFNFIRAALHFGTETDIDQALSVARETLAADPALLEIDPCDDVMTWDYCAEFFNYRSYFDEVTESHMTGEDRREALKALILASIAHYCGRMTGEIDFFADAAAYDPVFPHYRLAYAKALVQQNDPTVVEQATEILIDLYSHSLLASEAWSLLKALHQEHGIALPDRTPIDQLVTRTLLDSDDEAKRNGAYFRAQRLGLSRNEGHLVRKSSERRAKLSVLLADMNGSHYPRLMAALQAQTLPRDEFEIVVVDVFDRIAPAVMAAGDAVVALGQTEYLYNRNAAFNTALARAGGEVVALFDRDCGFREDSLSELQALFEDRQNGAFMVVNDGAAPFDRTNLHFLALTKSRAIRAGGLDESPLRAAGRGGPHELAERLQADRPETATMKGFSDVATVPSSDIASILWDLTPYAFSTARRLPNKESPAIRRLRERL